MKKSITGVSAAMLDSDYKAENDARTLMESELIKGDKSRHGPAKKKANIMAKDRMKEANALKKLGGKPLF